MSLKITTLIENSQGKNLDLKIEHGISFYVEKDDFKLLFDTGGSEAFLYNAEKLNINLRNLDAVVLSHGHYDHTGGLMALTKTCNKFDLFFGQGFFNEKYSFKNNSYKYSGNNFTEKDLLQKKIKYHFIKIRKTEILKNIYILTNFDKTNKDEIINNRFKLYKNEEFIPDLFNDEILLAIDTPNGIIILVGCSHPGIKNMIDTVMKEFDKPVYAVFGGTHLVESKEESLQKSIQYLKNESIKMLGISHCTGAEAIKRLKKNKNFFDNSTGSTFCIN